MHKGKCKPLFHKIYTSIILIMFGSTFFFFHNCIYVLTTFNLVLSSYLSSTDI